MTYAEIVDKLQLSKFIDDHREAICKKLSSAGAAFLKRKDDHFAVNNCLHIASSAVLLGSDSRTLAEILESLQQEYSSDPTTVVTVAVLYYSVTSLLKDSSQKQLAAVHRRFDEMNWLVGDAVKGLNIQPLGID